MLRALYLAALALIVYLSHRMLIPAGGAVINPDGAVYPITGEWIRQGHWPIFQIDYSYGGNTLTYVRAAWLHLFSKLGAAGVISATDYTGAPLSPLLLGQYTFTHYFVPWLLAVSLAVVVEAYVSTRTAAVIGVLCAIGFFSWDIFMHIEFYSGYIILGCWLLWLGARSGPAPLLSMSYGRLILAGALSGLATYTCRAAIVYVAALWLPLPWAWRQFKETVFARPSRSVERVLLLIAYVMAGLYAYLELFGSSLGQWNGKSIKLHAGPNLQIAILALGIIWLMRNAREIQMNHVLRAGLVAIGFCIGFAPEIWLWAQGGPLPALTGGRNYSWADTATVIGRIPGALKIIFSNTETVLGNASILLLLAALAGVVQRVRRQGIDIVVASGLLAAFAYARVLTYDFAPPRYLMPIFPMLLVGLAEWMRTRWALPSRKVWAAAIVVLFSIHSLDTWASRARWVETSKAEHRASQSAHIIERFRQMGVAYVWSDDYLFGNQLAVQADWNPFFIPYPPGWALKANARAAAHSPVVGYITLVNSNATPGALATAPTPPRSHEREISGRKYRLTHLERVSSPSVARDLWIAESVTCPRPLVFFDLGETLITSRKLESGASENRFLPGASELLEGLSKDDFKLGLITNVPDEWGPTDELKVARLKSVVRESWPREELASLIRWELFDLGVSVPPRAELRKPHPHLFEVARARATELGCPAVYLGETQGEILAARAAGLGAIQVGIPGQSFFPSRSEILKNAR